MNERAVFVRMGDQVQVTLERTFEQSPAQVWAHLTDTAELPRWLAPGTIEPRAGGTARLDFGDSGVVVDSLVTAFEPQRLIEYSWSGPEEPARPLRWEILPAGQGSRLRLTMRLPASEDAGRSAAGFEAHLEMLAAALEGVPIKFPFETFKAARDAYRAELAARNAA